MGIARSHHGAAVLEDLHVVDGLQAAQLAKLFHPGMDDGFDRFRRHGRQRKIVSRRKTDYSAKARLALRHQQSESFHIEAFALRSRFQSREIVVENKGRFVPRIPNAAHTSVSRTEVAARVVRWFVACLKLSDLSLPGTSCAMR